MITLDTQRNRIRAVVEWFKQGWCPKFDCFVRIDPATGLPNQTAATDPKDAVKLHKLEQLDLDCCSVSDVDQILGVDGWHRLVECSACRKEQTDAVVFSGYNDIRICHSCLKDAHVKLEKALKAKPKSTCLTNH